MFVLVVLLTAACRPPAAEPDVDHPDDTPSDTAAADTDEPVHSDDPVDDADHDGAPDRDDCDDTDPLVFPGADERCNGIDDDCDGYPHAAEGPGGATCRLCDAGGFWPVAREDFEGAAMYAALAEAVEVGPAVPGYPYGCSYGATGTDAARGEMYLHLDNDNGLVTCVYTGRTFDVVPGEAIPSGLSAEHSWPQSLGTEEPPPECDLHHLFPAYQTANSARGVRPFRDVVTPSGFAEGGSRNGLDADGVQAFEPRDAHKGVVARAMLYMDLRYAVPPWRFQLTEADLRTFRRWAARFPADDREIQRSLDVLAYQGNGNPFVVCPDLLDRVLFPGD